MAATPHVIALDLGGTDLKAASVSAAGEVLEFIRTPSRADESTEALMDALAAAANRWRSGALAVGIGVPGVVDPASGTLVDATPHLALPRDFPVRSGLERVLALPVFADNDANCAALAEYRVGAARGARVAIVITVGTGVGCGIVIDGRVLRGAWGGAGEIGHMAQRSSGPPCDCGVEGCAEPLAGGGGLPGRARALGLSVTGAIDVFAAAGAGDERARMLLAELTDALAGQVACAVQTLNPEVVVLGVRNLRIVPAALGDRAGVVGAGLLAWEGMGPASP